MWGWGGIKQSRVVYSGGYLRPAGRRAWGGAARYLPLHLPFFNNDDRNYVEPNISVICDRDKLTERGCAGAPDWIIEIVSPGIRRKI